MRTIKLLATATAQNVAAVIATAQERQWTPELIAKHGNDIVRQHLTGEAPKAKAKGKGKAKAGAPALVLVAQQVSATPYRAPKAKGKGKRKVRVAPKFAEQGRVPLTLVRDGDTLTGTLVVGQTRKKLVGSGETTDARLQVGEFTQTLTLSPKMVESLQTTGTRLWVGGKSYIATITRS